jgi:hypothetical protein
MKRIKNLVFFGITKAAEEKSGIGSILVSAMLLFGNRVFREAVLWIRIRDSVPCLDPWIWDPGWVKKQDLG